MQTSNKLTKQQASLLTEQDWQNRLTDEEYTVLREKGTERPFTGEYNRCNESGIYLCKGCGAELFLSKNKFDSGCGWPSFDNTVNTTVIDEHFDSSHGMSRTEVTCHNCGGHLGHVFDDGPVETTGLRYCINSLAIHLQKANEC